MLFKIILTLALLAFAAYGLLQRRTSRLVGGLSTFFCISGLVLVWNPELSTEIANIVGVGRGADLVFYVFIAVMGFVGLYLHLRIESTIRMITDLARANALQNPLYPGSDPDGPDGAASAPISAAGRPDRIRPRKPSD